MGKHWSRHRAMRRRAAAALWRPCQARSRTDEAPGRAHGPKRFWKRSSDISCGSSRRPASRPSCSTPCAGWSAGRLVDALLLLALACLPGGMLGLASANFAIGTARTESVAQRVAEEVEAEHGEDERQHWPEHHPGIAVDQEGLRLRDHASPFRRRWRRAQAEEAQHRLVQDADALQLERSSQVRRIRDDDVLADQLVPVQVETAGGPQPMEMLTAWAIPTWLTGIKLGKVAPAKRDAIRAFKREAADVLYQHFANQPTLAQLAAPAMLAPSAPITRPVAPAEGASPAAWLEFHRQMVAFVEWQGDVERLRVQVEARHEPR